jgi:hypothetical protein
VRYGDEDFADSCATGTVVALIGVKAELALLSVLSVMNSEAFQSSKHRAAPDREPARSLWVQIRDTRSSGGTTMKRNSIQSHGGQLKPARHLMAGLLATVACVTAATPAFSAELLWSTNWSNWTTIESVVWSAPPKNVEAADDFDVDGTVERIIVAGYNSCLAVCFPPPVSGVFVRFYAWTAAGPGALQDEQFIPASDPGFLYNANNPAALDIMLPAPFAATGQHFLSVQLVFEDGFYWAVWVANHGNAAGSHLWVRDNLAAGGWEQYVDVLQDPLNDDLNFSLYGTPAGGIDPTPPVAGCGAWALVDSPNPAEAIDARLNSVEVISPWDVWAVGNYTFDPEGVGLSDQHSLAMHWDGTAWSIVPSPSPTPAVGLMYVDLSAVSAAGPNDVWAAGQKNFTGQGGYVGTRVMALHWDGSAWSEIPLPVPQQASSEFQGASGDRLLDVVAIAPDDVWLVGAWYRFLPSDAVIWPGVAMHWDGSDMEVFEPPFVTTTTQQWLNAVDAVASDDVWAVGEGGGSVSYIFHFDGSAWSHVPGPVPGTSRVLSEVLALASDDVWVGGYYSTASDVFPLLLHWNGISWTQVASPAGGLVLAAFAADDIFTAGVNGFAHWNGASWSAEPGPEIIPWGGVSDLEFVNPCELWGVGMKSVAGTYDTLTVQLEPVTNPADDSDGDGVANDADNCPTHFNPDQNDCDADGAGNLCELVTGTAQDCNGNFAPDNCETFTDCNANAVPDECEPDCQGNGVADACDIAAAASLDCNANGVPDECDSFADCNLNDVDDACDVNGGGSVDSNANGVPDECEALGGNFATVTITADVVDFGGAQQLADLPGPDGEVSFREALTAANNTPGPQTVAFNIPQSEWWLDDSRALLEQDQGIFAVNDDFTTLDFTTQTAFTGDTNPNGNEVGIFGVEPNAWGVASIYVNADNCTITGLDDVLQRGYGVRLVGNNNRVISCTIGGPFFAGVYITGGFGGPPATGNVVGGTAPGEGNVLSSGGDGVLIDGPAENNVVIGNTLTGSSSGATIRAGATGNRIGGLAPGEGNLIAGAGHYGEEGCPTGMQVEIDGADGNIVEGNRIGTTADGSAAAPSQIGTGGIVVRNSSGTTIRSNQVSGIRVTGFDHCSGDVYGVGIEVVGTSDGTVIEGNKVGTDASGTADVPSLRGIVVEPWIPSTLFPTATQITGNTIAFNEVEGVLVVSNATGTTVSQNAIFDNGSLGIATLFGGNGDPAAPAVASALSDGGSALISGTLAGATPGGAYVIEVFGNEACDPSGFGEGQVYLGSVTVTTNGSGAADFSLMVQAAGAGSTITATSTELASGNTSEFSACRPVQAGTVSCADTADCAAPGGGPRADGCTWWACVDGSCVGAGIVFADMGSAFGACAPDGSSDAHDRFHALNCFADTDTAGSSGYPCEAAPPAAYNVDAGGPFGDCAPDGICDANDAFHALNAFSGTGSCQCPMDGPAPAQAPAERGAQQSVHLQLQPTADRIGSGEQVEVEVVFSGPLQDLRGYQLHVDVRGGKRGRLELVDMAVEPRKDHVFAGRNSWQASNLRTAQLAAGLDGPGLAVPAGGYVATLTLEASADASGLFVVDLLYEKNDASQRSFVFATPAGARIDIAGTTPAVIDVRPVKVRAGQQEARR